MLIGELNSRISGGSKFNSYEVNLLSLSLFPRSPSILKLFGEIAVGVCDNVLISLASELVWGICYLNLECLEADGLV